VGYNGVFGYFIEVSKAQAHKVPHYFVRKQTLVNAERYITEELKTLEDKILGAEEKMSKLEAHLFGELRERVRASLGEIKTFASGAAELDVFYALAESAVRYEFTRPRVNSGDLLKVDEATWDTGSSYLIVDTGPWILGKKVMLPAGVVSLVDHPNKRVVVNRTKDQIKGTPEFDESMLADTGYRERLGKYYGEGGAGWYEYKNF